MYAVLIFFKSFWNVIIKRSYWFQYHLEGRVISSLILSCKYRTGWIIRDPKNKYWILMFRLRNIKRIKRDKTKEWKTWLEMANDN